MFKNGICNFTHRSRLVITLDCLDGGSISSHVLNKRFFSEVCFVEVCLHVVEHQVCRNSAVVIHGVVIRHKADVVGRANGNLLVVPAVLNERGFFGNSHSVAKTQISRRARISNVHPQRTALELQQIGDGNKLGIGSALDIACSARGRERSVLVPAGKRHALLGRIRPGSLVAAAVILQQIRALGKLDAVRAAAVVGRSVTRSQVAGAFALRGDVGVEADERTAADGDICTAVRIRIINAVEQILAAAFPLLVQVEGAALDGQGALLHLNHADVTVEGAVFDGQIALLHVDGVAVVLLGIYGAVASDGHLGAICDGQDGVGIIAPDVLRVLDGLAVQVKRDVLVDGQLGVLLNIRQ